MDADFLLIDNVCIDAFVSEDTRDIKSNNHCKMGEKIKQVHFVGCQNFFSLIFIKPGLPEKEIPRLLK